MMNSARFRVSLLLFFFSVVTAALASQTKQPSGSQLNLFKEALDHKDQIQWRPAPPPGIPPDVCVMFKVCEEKGAPKLVTLPRATEGGQPVGRALLLSRTKDSKNPDAILLEHQTVSELYFFLLSTDGNIQKAAYIQQGSSSWIPLASSLARPVFEKDTKDWHDWIMKLGAPAAK